MPPATARRSWPKRSLSTPLAASGGLVIKARVAVERRESTKSFDEYVTQRFDEEGATDTVTALMIVRDLLLLAA